MDKFAGLISNIELFIRYLLSGAAIYAIYLISLFDATPHIKWISEQPLLAAFVAGAVGFTAYSIYRICFWIFGDGVAWLCGVSAPTLHGNKSKLYHRPYARFLLWRRQSGFDGSLDGYLNYRWAVVHFTYIIVFSLWFSLLMREDGSLIAQWQCLTETVSVFLFVIVAWQSSFLFRVERELYSYTLNDIAQK